VKGKGKARSIADGPVIRKRKRVESSPAAGPSRLAVDSSEEECGSSDDDLVSAVRGLGEAEAMIAKGHELASRNYGRLADALAKRGF